MKQIKKIQSRLDSRVAAHQSLVKNGVNKLDIKVQQRIETGGYRQPGSRKKVY